MVFPGPGIYRGMFEENGMPKLGDDPKCLGVRVPPNPNPDITPDANGNVHFPTLSEPHGLSCALSIQNLPKHRRPAQWSGIQNKPNFKVWKIDDKALGPDLVAFHDSPNHITSGPARTMTLGQFQAALATTQSKWTLVTP